MKPQNPLIDEAGMSDPHALVRGDEVYLFTGHDVGYGVPDWVMPDWRIYRSTDLRLWEQVGTIRPDDSYLGAGCTSCWAGDIVEREAGFFWYFSHPKQGTGVMRAERPEGPYTDALGHALVDSFDPTIFVEDDGTPYIVYGHGDYKIARLKNNMVELAETPQSLPLDRRGVFPVMDKNSLHKTMGIYYLSCSGYYATSESLYGPYVHRGLVGEGMGLDTPYAHGDFFVWKGNWYHVWCKYRNRDFDRIRDSFLAPVVYDQDGRMRHQDDS